MKLDARKYALAKRQPGCFSFAKNLRAPVCRGEIDRRLLRPFEVAGGVLGQRGRLEAHLVDVGHAGLVQPRPQIGRLMVHAERWRREARGVDAGGEHQRGVLVLQKAEVAGSGLRPHSRPG